MSSVRVLVTGAGSGVGQAIIKSLNICNYKTTIISADISPFNASLYRTDEALLIPKVENPGAINDVIKIIKRNDIHVVMVGSEFDLKFFSKNKEVIYTETGAKVIVSSLETVEIANDKWLTTEFLHNNDLPYAEAFASESLDLSIDRAEAWGFPVILKPRSGTSSRNVHIVGDSTQLINSWPHVPSPMIQRMIDMPSVELNNEYTCSIFKTDQGTILGPFNARRTLRGGTSWKIEVCQSPCLDRLLLDIGQKLQFIGSLNIQLMIGKDGPVPFEFNARFSGTTAVRAHFGFNEPALAIQSFYYGEEPEQPVIRKGVAMRYHEEIFVDNVSPEGLSLNIDKGRKRDWF